MSERDKSGHREAGAGSPTAPDRVAEGLAVEGDGGPEPGDVVQAVAALVDDLVEDAPAEDAADA